MRKILQHPVTYMAMPFLFLAAMPLIMYFTCGQGGDIAPIDDKNLIFKSRNVPDSENAIYYFHLAFREFENFAIKSYQIENAIENAESDRETLDKTLESLQKEKIWENNAKCLDLIEQGLSCQKADYLFPTVKRHDPSFNTSRLTGISLILCMQAILYTHQSQPDKAIQTAHKVIKYGDRLGEYRLFYEWFLGNKEKMRALTAIRYIVKTAKPSKNIVFPYIAKLKDSIDPKKQKFKDFMIGEYALFLNRIDKALTEEISSKLFFKPNKTKKDIVTAINKVIKIAEKPQQLVDKEKDLLLRPLPFLNNGVGDSIICTFPVIDGLLEHNNVTDNEVQMTRVFLAMYCYHKDSGKYPEKLEDLVPEYLPTIPIDYFDGKPLKYDAEQKTIYTAKTKNFLGGIVLHANGF